MRELLKLDFQRLFDGVLFKLALGVCAVLGIWDLVLNVQAHYANMEALKTQTIAYSYPSSVYNSCIAADGIYLPSILLFLPDILHHTDYTKADTKMDALHKTNGLPAQQPSSEMYKMQFQGILLEGTSY